MTAEQITLTEEEKCAHCGPPAHPQQSQMKKHCFFLRYIIQSRERLSFRFWIVIYDLKTRSRYGNGFLNYIHSLTIQPKS